MYSIPSKSGFVEIGGKRVWTDSKLEGRVLLWLENHGFHDRWSRPDTGAANGGSRYTGDIELAVELDGRTQRAIVEIKPFKSALTADIIKRMRGVASFYKTDLLLLYEQRENTWYRIDMNSGLLTEFGQPMPGVVPFGKLPKPFSLTSQKLGKKYYQKRVNPGGWLADLVIGLIQGPKPKRRRKH